MSKTKYFLLKDQDICNDNKQDIRKTKASRKKLDMNNERERQAYFKKEYIKSRVERKQLRSEIRELKKMVEELKMKKRQQEYSYKGCPLI